MKQTFMRPIKDAAKMRRDYLRQMGDAGRATLLWGCIGIGFIVVSVIGFVFVFALHTRSSGPLYPPDLPFPFSQDARRLEYVLSLLWLVPVTLGFIGLCAAGIRHVQAKKVHYIPPCEKIDAAPADEVLLQGSAPPDAAASELLRVSQERTET